MRQYNNKCPDTAIKTSSFSLSISGQCPIFIIYVIQTDLNGVIALYVDVRTYIRASVMKNLRKERPDIETPFFADLCRLINEVSQPHFS